MFPLVPAHNFAAKRMLSLLSYHSYALIKLSTKYKAFPMTLDYAHTKYFQQNREGPNLGHTSISIFINLSELYELHIINNLVDRVYNIGVISSMTKMCLVLPTINSSNEFILHKCNINCIYKYVTRISFNNFF